MTKLIDILVEELEEWPEGVNYITGKNNSCYQVGGFHYYPTLQERLGGYWIAKQGYIWRMSTNNPLAEDWKESVITKQMWEKAKEHKMNKTFGVEDLKDWMRVVAEVDCLHHRYEYIVATDSEGNKFLAREGAFASIDSTYFKKNDWFAFVEVYDKPLKEASYLDPKAKGVLLWKREEKTEAQKKLEELESTSKQLNEQIAQLKKEIGV